MNGQQAAREGVAARGIKHRVFVQDMAFYVLRKARRDHLMRGGGSWTAKYANKKQSSNNLVSGSVLFKAPRTLRKLLAWQIVCP